MNSVLRFFKLNFIQIEYLSIFGTFLAEAFGTPEVIVTKPSPDQATASTLAGSGANFRPENSTLVHVLVHRESEEYEKDEEGIAETREQQSQEEKKKKKRENGAPAQTSGLLIIFLLIIFFSFFFFCFNFLVRFYFIKIFFVLILNCFCSWN